MTQITQFDRRRRGGHILRCSATALAAVVVTTAAAATTGPGPRPEPLMGVPIMTGLARDDLAAEANRIAPRRPVAARAAIPPNDVVAWARRTLSSNEEVMVSP
ncbi:hypothetical protein [Burkholderia ubonensis]|uniref:hypothetical protein n=1 Tax=Burkholderia ubonensis TaxID=101571 RepID=UPI00075A3DD5|nr:hypothetical protein [Burkholderia ubonensis]AOI68814.1 hypothetical protein WI31_04140 [Burkholderia ubonensis]KUZ10153.1 hypothetical protein WI29_32965 [Burkholderia ubonensis]KUZ20350.1 hypothetical protein WI30_34230 [Burkholderia ubonensis]KUZ36286.1 hypothetical protein WI32_14350 [Burkholderia ubonensis]KUZ40497.1 hypothetical protein WI33_34040 [Burkholderia ubonensis]